MVTIQNHRMMQIFGYKSFQKLWTFQFHNVLYFHIICQEVQRIRI